MWPFTKHKIVIAEHQRLQQDIEHANRLRAEITRQWPAVNSIRKTLVTRRLENGFGEQLEVAWTPKGMH